MRPAGAAPRMDARRAARAGDRAGARAGSGPLQHELLWLALAVPGLFVLWQALIGAGWPPLLRGLSVGRELVRPLAPGPALAQPLPEPCLEARESRTDGAPAALQLDDRLRAGALPAALSVRLLDAQGRGLGPCRLIAWRGREAHEGAPLDPESATRLVLPAGSYRLELKPESLPAGFLPGWELELPELPETGGARTRSQRLRFDARRDLRVDLRLHRAASLAGRLLAPEGSALAEVRIALLGLDGALPPTARYARTDASGGFEFSQLYPGRHVVWVEAMPAAEGARRGAAGHACAAPEHRLLVLGEAEAGLVELRAQPAGGVVSGRLLRSDGAPCAGYRLSCELDGEQRLAPLRSDQRALASTCSDESGAFELRGLASRPHALLASALPVRGLGLGRARADAAHFLLRVTPPLDCGERLELGPLTLPDYEGCLLVGRVLGLGEQAPKGSAPHGRSPTGPGSTGSVPTGSVPTGSVPTGSVPAGSAPTGPLELELRVERAAGTLSLPLLPDRDGRFFWAEPAAPRRVELRVERAGQLIECHSWSPWPRTCVDLELDLS